MKSYFPMLVKSVALSIAASALAACSAHVDATNPPIPLSPTTQTPPKDTKQSSAFPNVVGKWTTQCHQDLFSQAFAISSVEFTASNYVYTTSIYSDNACKSSVVNTNKMSGPYKFVSANSDGTFTVSYTDVQGAVSVPYNNQLLKLDGEVLYLSVIAQGNTQLDTANPFRQDWSKVPANPPAPAPVPPGPQPTNGTIGTRTQPSFAKFAFCNVQGSAVMIDFQNTVLGASAKGKLNIGVRGCNHPDMAFDWAMKDVPFTESQASNTTYTFDLGNGNSMGSDATGNASIMLNGNTGFCAFLSNQGTLGVIDDPAYGQDACN